MNKHRITSDERAVSGLVGEILLIGIVIVAIGLIAVSVHSYLNKDPDTPHIEVDGVANMRTNEIHIKHQGGDPIECENLRVLVSVNGTLLDPFDDNSPTRWGLSDEGIGNFDRWTLGKILVLDTMPEVNITDDDEIRVSIVSLSSSRVVVSGEVFGGLFGNASINMLPIADAGDDQTDGLCANTTWAEVWAWFNGSGSYDPDNPTGGIYRGIVSWQWDFGDENESDVLDEPYVWYNYSTNGNYTVTLTVTDVDGATDTDTCIVTILPPANLTADAGPEQWVGRGTEVRLNGSGSTGCINESRWEFGDGTNATVNASTTTHTYTTVGDYTVNLTVVEDHTGKTASDTAIIHVMSGFKIVYPYDGDWVSDPVPIDARAFDIKTDYVNFNISSVSNEVSYSQNATNHSGESVVHNTTKYTYGWNTTGLGCGNYTIHATAYNEDGAEMGTDNITVCVCNTPDLVGLWYFDDGTGSTTANDSSCYKNHGTIYGDPTWITDGTLYALQFNGSSDYVEVANSTSLAMTNKTTIGAWANSSDAGEQYILAKGDMVFELEDEVVRQNESNLGWDPGPGFGGTRKRAQTFKLDSNARLNNVSVYIKNIGGWMGETTGDINVAIYADDGTGTQPGAVVASATIPDTAVSTSYAWITMPFNHNLTGGDTYWLVLESPGGCYGDTSYYWGASFNGIANGYYVDGEAWDYNSPWASLWGVDMTFELNITTSTYTDRISMPDPDNFKYLVYYAQLNCTYLNWSESGLELVMVADSNEAEITAVQKAGVKVYYYIALGHTYNDSVDKGKWYANITAEMDAHNYTDGFVWDELDPEFFDPYYGCIGGTGNKTQFDAYLEELNAHAHNNLSKKTVANGVRYYANHCGSDYYMWESFISSYHGTILSPDYYYGDFFNTTGVKDDANVWINGIKKYEYLRVNGVLNKTLVHSFGEPDDDNKSIYDYIASRVLGVKGFSYADSGNFALEPATIAEGLRWDLGTRMSYDVGSTTPGCLSGRFTNGYVTDYVNWSFSHNSTNYTTDLISDPLTAHLLDSSSRVTGLDLCLIRGQVDFMHGVLRSSTDITGQDSWHHNSTAATILNALNGTATLLVNGIPAAKRTFPNGLPFDFTGSDLIIGANNTGAYGFNGSIEEVRIYDS